MSTERARLDSISTELADRLRNTSEEGLRRVATAAGRLGVARILISDARIDMALAALDRGELDGDMRVRLDGLVEELDQAAWEVQQRAHAGRALENDYVTAFAKARAASALACALDVDPKRAAMEAVYEAQAALGDLMPVRNVVLEILGR